MDFNVIAYNVICLIVFVAAFRWYFKSTKKESNDTTD